MRAYAVDLGGTRIKLAVIESGIILAQSIIPANQQETTAKRMDRVAAELRLLAKQTKSESITKIGIAFAGIVNSKERKIVTSNGKYLDADKMDFVSWCRNELGAEPTIENDANTALAGELTYGVGEKCCDAVMMILGTGVGTAAVIDGKLLRGRHFQAGCLGGHMPIEVGGRVCTCGNHGCVEANASTWALPLIAREDANFAASGLSQENLLDFEALEKWYLRGDLLAVKLTKRFADCWSAGIAGLIHAYDPEMVILSGGVMKFSGLFEMIQKRVKNSVWSPWGEVNIVLAKSPEQSVLLGLYSLMERNF